MFRGGCRVGMGGRWDWAAGRRGDRGLGAREGKGIRTLAARPAPHHGSMFKFPRERASGRKGGAGRGWEWGRKRTAGQRWGKVYGWGLGEWKVEGDVMCQVQEPYRSHFPLFRPLRGPLFPFQRASRCYARSHKKGKCGGRGRAGWVAEAEAGAEWAGRGSLSVSVAMRLF